MEWSRHTRQREAVVNCLRRADGPLSIAALHEMARQSVPNLGLTTVYRVVKALRESGEVQIAELPGEEPHYEPADRGHHHHFQCLECERVLDLQHAPHGILDGTTLPGGHVVEDHHITLYGRCAACLS